jgi:hypothetical protein
VTISQQKMAAVDAFFRCRFCAILKETPELGREEQVAEAEDR